MFDLYSFIDENKTYKCEQIETFLYKNKELMNDNLLINIYYFLYIKLLEKYKIKKDKINEYIIFCNNNINKIIVNFELYLLNNKIINDDNNKQIMIYINDKNKFENIIYKNKLILDKINVYEEIINKKLHLILTNNLNKLYEYIIDSKRIEKITL
jgi:hypothetical protein